MWVAAVSCSCHPFPHLWFPPNFLDQQDVLFSCALGSGRDRGRGCVFGCGLGLGCEAIVQKAVAEFLPEVAVLVLSVGQGTRMPLADVELYAGHASLSGCTLRCLTQAFVL
jgi:hypothetical protein